ncbi:enoyl-CoA hydratase-related protein [uncultured Sneathiella sp.]|uniref:enoyl-CoA hydratase/isomerase family protein n=1 Tax=uncultured Sneathiella sp. TaxID=879315 RepID=UPI0030EB9C3B|tara:strand:+ start:6309 stop:7091 length:783 start_codon:yes stop_codon:yes gene_type:complete
MTEKSILLEKNNKTGVAILTLNRPDQFNAFNREMVNLWADTLIDIAADKNIRAMVLTGAGKAFCAGGDMDELDSFLTMNMSERKSFLYDNVYRVMRQVHSMDIPIIAALNGTARGAGLDMALMCDIRIADRSAAFAESYIAMGLIAGDGGSYFLPRLVGLSKALELLWTGDVVSGEEAVQIGMVSRVVDDGQALAEAVKFAERIAKQPTEAVRMMKRAAIQGFSTTLDSHLDMISSHMAILEDSLAFKERVAAFQARRRK